MPVSGGAKGNTGFNVNGSPLGPKKQNLFLGKFLRATHLGAGILLCASEAEASHPPLGASSIRSIGFGSMYPEVCFPYLSAAGTGERKKRGLQEACPLREWQDASILAHSECPGAPEYPNEASARSISVGGFNANRSSHIGLSRGNFGESIARLFRSKWFHRG